MDDAPVPVKARKIGVMPPVQEASAHDQVFAPYDFLMLVSSLGLALPVTFLQLCTNFPFSLILKPATVVYVSVEKNILAEVEYLVDMSEILTNLLVAWEALLKAPCMVDFGNAELVVWPFRVNACARISVPVPNATKVGGSLNDKCRYA